MKQSTQTAKRARLVYLTVFLLLLVVEIMIGMYVHDSFVRPYVGDMLVVILLWALVRIFIPYKAVWLSAAVCIFSVIVELTQLIPLVDFLGIENRLIRVIMGTSFAYADLFAYAAGCAVTAVIDLVLFRKRKKIYDVQNIQNGVAP
jgi:hypothetical protein